METAHEDLLKFYRELVQPGDLCFDVGANNGDKAALMLECGARVVCVEPQPACIEALRERFDGVSEVTIVAAAAGEAPGEIDLMVCTDAPTISTASQRWTTGRFAGYRWDSVQRVQVTTLDALIEQHGTPRYCKIDVEGYERQVLGGLSQPAGAVSFEFTEEFFDEARACMDRLRAIGMRAFDVAIGETPRFELGSWVSQEQLEETLLSRFEGDCWGDIYCVRG